MEYDAGEIREPEYQVYRSFYERLPGGNLFEALELSAAKYPDKPAVIDDREQVTYRELTERIRRLAGFLKKCGVKPGDRAGLLFVNDIGFVTVFYALAKLGAIAVMVNTKLQPPQIRFILEDTGTRLLLMDQRWKDKTGGYAGEIGIERTIFDDEIAREAKNQKRRPLMETESGGWRPAAIMHTSGTTGTPKGVMISHRNILETACGYHEIQGLVPEDITVLSVPIFHILGLSCVTTNFMTLGGTVILTDFYRPARILENITRYRATHFHSVPTVFLQLMEEYGKNGSRTYDLSSLRITVCGGAVIQTADVERFCQLVPSASFRLAYGMTETAGGGTVSPGHRQGLMPSANVAVDIIDKDGNPVPDGTLGQVVFKGPVVVRSFWKGSRETDGRLESGDLAWRDEQGFLHVMDRLKDIISRGGEKIFPSSVEQAILECGGVREAAVFAVKDALYGELPAAVITPQRDCKPDVAQIYEYLKTRIARYETPCMIEVWTELPKTSNGKIRKAALKDFFEKERMRE